MTHDDARFTELLIYRCETCGDVFPVHEEEAVTCPSCGSTGVALASEPML